MGAIITLIVCTVIGAVCGVLFAVPPELLLGAGIGLFVGTVLVVLAGGDDVGDIIEDIADGFSDHH